MSFKTTTFPDLKGLDVCDQSPRFPTGGPLTAKEVKRWRYAKYNKLRADYLKGHPICEVCRSNPSRFIHHKVSRKTHLLDSSVFQAVCSKECERASEGIEKAP